MNRIPLNSKTAYNTAALHLAGNSETTMQFGIQAPDFHLLAAATDTQIIDGHKTDTVILMDEHEL